ncbi:VENN motif pre-toxin domain-containing protein [Neisseria arctica]|uniref:VENN motif pre-toxin domain-containing protein n=1 Tax=Neisseria arctica TaxID=1470200 RepID=UPI0006995CC4|nr:VENN motif pre-toxin domain-containing protein [Neisseria arctica]UOO87163.1 VENN motif pre-toxin domain-containing protein [Neisseria arctica]
MGGQSDLQAAANTLAPYAAAAIGQQFGHGENKNEAAQILGHFALGATLAYINGSSPASGGSAAVAAEKAAQYLAQQYDDGQTARDPITGEFNANLLPEHIKDEIKAATGAIAAVVGATGDGGSALGAQIGGVIGQNAVENNFSLSDFGISPNAQSNLQQMAHQRTQQFIVNANSTAAERKKLFDLLKTYKANAALTAEVTAALGLGANLSVTINQDKSIVITAALTAGTGFEAFAGLSASNVSRGDGAFTEVCSTAGGGIVLGGCAGAHLSRNEPLVLTGKVGGGASAIANANIGYQWTVNVPKSKGNTK